MSRLTIEVSTQQHKQIKALAALQGKTIKDLILEKLFDEQAQNEEEVQAWEQLKTLLDDRIEQAKQGKLSTQNIAQISQTVLDRQKR